MNTSRKLTVLGILVALVGCSGGEKYDAPESNAGASKQFESGGQAGQDAAGGVTQQKSNDSAASE